LVAPPNDELRVHPSSVSKESAKQQGPEAESGCVSSPFDTYITESAYIEGLLVVKETPSGFYRGFRGRCFHTGIRIAFRPVGVEYSNAEGVGARSG